ncbi:MAG: 4Fe-4S dicluster-binding protein [Alphaproteobacteria bacterium]
MIRLLTVRCNMASVGKASLAFIHASCVGCTKCMKVCPEKAISGARRRLHLVNPALCTGCGDCVPVCPVDCITLDGKPIAKPVADEPAVPVALPPEVAARIAAARQTMQAKWEHKKAATPKVLSGKTGKGLRRIPSR